MVCEGRAWPGAAIAARGLERRPEKARTIFRHLSVKYQARNCDGAQRPYARLREALEWAMMLMTAHDTPKPTLQEHSMTGRLAVLASQDTFRAT